MGYAIQMCVNQASGLPKVVSTSIEKIRPLAEVIKIAKARLKVAPVSGSIITDEGIINLADVGRGAVFIRFVELDDGVPTERVVFQKALAELDQCPEAPKGKSAPPT